MGLYDAFDEDDAAPKPTDDRKAAGATPVPALAAAPAPIVPLMVPVKRRPQAQPPQRVRPAGGPPRPATAQNPSGAAVRPQSGTSAAPTQAREVRASIPLPNQQQQRPSRYRKKSKKAEEGEDYDPAKPNEYEICKQEAKRRRREERERRDNPPPTIGSGFGGAGGGIAVGGGQGRENERGRENDRERDREQDRKSEYSEDDDDDIDGMPMDAPAPSKPTVFADATGEDAFKRRSQMAAMVMADSSGEDAYARRMQMSGAGRQAAASASGAGARQEREREERQMDRERRAAMPADPNATRVLLLKNMVGPGEVDDDLQDETSQECSRFGDVERCLIFEVPNGQVPDEESVRIFVKFREVGAAEMARENMDQRFFGGRSVSASFYSEEKFDRFDLAPTL